MERQIRSAIRDAVNRSSRKPFHWGGLAGYQQLQAMAQELHRVAAEPETVYLQQLARQVARVLEKNQALAQDLQQAHIQAKRIANCLRYPLGVDSGLAARAPAGSEVADEMQALLQQFQPNLKAEPAQAALRAAWHRLWKTWGAELLPCYDLPGLPPDNLKLEGLFGRLRRHQRRITGCRSTRELRDLGHYQVLFGAETETDLLRQLRQVPLAEYQAHRHRLAEAEAQRQFLCRLHRDPGRAIRKLITKYTVRRTELAPERVLPRTSSLHTD